MSLYLDAAVYHTHTRQYDAPAVAGDGVALLEGQFKKVTGDAEMAQIIARARGRARGAQPVQTKKAA